MRACHERNEFYRCPQSAPTFSRKSSPKGRKFREGEPGDCAFIIRAELKSHGISGNAWFSHDSAKAVSAKWR